MTDQEWRMHAACRSEDAELFYPIGKGGTETLRRKEARAKRICADCPVRPECLRFALGMVDQHGIFGGRTAEERLALLQVTG